MDLFDYLETTLETFDEKPLNPVDSAALSQFCMVRGEGAQAALERAAKLLEISIAEAVADGTDPNEGIAFEHPLRLLME